MNADIKEFTCGKCGNVYYSRDDLRSHIFNDHLYPEVKAADLDKLAGDDNNARSRAIENVHKAVVSDLLAGEAGGSEFAEIVKEGISKAGYTHEILRNPQGRCVVAARDQPRPPNWQVIHTGSEAACRSLFRTKCGAGQGGNKC